MNLRSLPKIDLHRHLEGAVRFETLRELAREVGLDFSPGELRRRTTMRGEKPGFQTFLSKFELYRGLYPSREWIERVAFEAVDDARRDGVVYLELRFSPTHFGRRLKAKGEDVAEWVARGARRAGIDVSFIATFGRDFGVRGNQATIRAIEGTTIFSGVDLAGNEAKSAMPFLSLFKRLGLPITIHAGEAGGAENIREAVERFGAHRIGHGVRVVDAPELAKKVHHVTFEVCPTSEIHTGAARSWRMHPVKKMLALDLHVTLNTDDPSISDTSLSAEIHACLRSGLTWSDIKRSMARAAEVAFLPQARRKLLSHLIEEQW